MRARRLAIIKLVAWLAACDGDATSRPDEGALPVDGSIDAAVVQDAARTDPLDGRVVAEAGASEAGTVDATMRSDGAPNAPAPDSGTADAVAPSACALPAPFDVGATYARELFVGPSGADSNDGSSARPFRTIRAAADRAQPGTRIVVTEGTYAAVALGRVQGEAARPIAFVARGSVIIDASSGSGWAMSDAAFVVVEGFTIQNASIHGMNLDDASSFETPAHHLVLRNLTVRNAGTGGNNDCIKMSGVDDFWIVGSDVSGCNRGEIVDMVGCHRGVISGNYFHETVQNGVQTKGGSADITIQANRFVRIPGRAVNAGGSTGLEFFRPLDAPHEAARIRIFSNVFVQNGADGGAAVAFVGCDGCVFAHNTVIEPRRWVARILQESTDARFVPSRDGLFVNNLIVLALADLSTIVNVGANTAPATFTFGNNLWFATDNASWAGPVLGAGIPSEGNSIVQRDPRLVDRTSGNYRPQSGSPLLGAARELPFATPSDFDGRCHGQPAAIGAFAGP